MYEKRHKSPQRYMAVPPILVDQGRSVYSGAFSSTIRTNNQVILILNSEILRRRQELQGAPGSAREPKEAAGCTR